MSSLVPRLPPNFPLLAVHSANNGILDRAWGTTTVISDSAYELSYAHVPQAVRTLSQ